MILICLRSRHLLKLKYTLKQLDLLRIMIFMVWGHANFVTILQEYVRESSMTLIRPSLRCWTTEVNCNTGIWNSNTYSNQKQWNTCGLRLRTGITTIETLLQKTAAYGKHGAVYLHIIWLYINWEYRSFGPMTLACTSRSSVETVRIYLAVCVSCNEAMPDRVMWFARWHIIKRSVFEDTEWLNSICW